MIASAALKTATGLISLFRQDVAVTTGDLTIGDAAFVAAVCSQLVGDGVIVHQPSLMSPRTTSAPSSVLDGLAKLTNLQVDVDARLGPLTLAKAGKTGEALALITDAHARLTSLAVSIGELRDGVAKADATSGVTPLAGLLRAEALAPTAKDAHVLWLKVEGAGGDAEVRQPGAFRSGKRLFSGGVIVLFALFDPQGAIADAATLPYYSGLLEVEEADQTINLADED